MTRDKGVFIRLSATEADALRRHAEQVGTSVSAYVRSACAVAPQAAEGRGLSEEDRETLAGARDQLARVGNNLNQIAWRVNSMGWDSKGPGQEMARECSRLLDEIRAQVARVDSALERGEAR